MYINIFIFNKIYVLCSRYFIIPGESDKVLQTVILETKAAIDQTLFLIKWYEVPDRCIKKFSKVLRWNRFFRIKCHTNFYFFNILNAMRVTGDRHLLSFLSVLPPLVLYIVLHLPSENKYDF